MGLLGSKVKLNSFLFTEKSQSKNSGAYRHRELRALLV